MWLFIVNFLLSFPQGIPSHVFTDIIESILLNDRRQHMTMTKNVISSTKRCKKKKQVYHALRSVRY